MRKQPTRADVAQLAGVSSAVVSYVVNNGPRPVSDKARRRVNSAIQELGYRPNQVAKALRSNRSLSVGLLLPDALNPFFWELTQYIERECLDRGYMLFIGTSDNDPQLEQHYLGAFEDRQVDGMIVISATADWSHTAPSSTPRVLIDRSPEHAARPVAKSDGAVGAHLAVSHLLDAHGRRRLLLLAGPPQLESTAVRREGALAAIDEVDGATATLVHSEFGFAEGYAAMRKHLASGSACDGIFAFSDVQAIGAVRACEDAGLAVPGDVSITAFDGTELTRFTCPRITSVEQDSAAMAAAAMDHLSRRIAGTEDPIDDAEPLIGTPHLRIQDSCGCTSADSESPV